MRADNEGQVTLPAATLVWQTIEYARLRTSNRQEVASGEYCRCEREYSFGAPCPCGKKSREAITQHYAIEWLMAHAHNDIALILEFLEQHQDLSLHVMSAIGKAVWDRDVDDAVDYEEARLFIEWLILQGEDCFRSVTSNGDLLTFCFDHKIHHDFMPAAIMEHYVAGHGVWEYNVREWFDERFRDGATPQDFAGWDAARVMAEFQAHRS